MENSSKSPTPRRNRMNRPIRKPAWTALALLLFAFVASCAFSDRAAYREQVRKMSDRELVAAYRNVAKQINALGREIHRDWESDADRRGNDISPETAAYFSSGYVDLLAKEKILLNEIGQRRLRR